MSDHDVPIEKITILVGHSSTKITETVYRHQLKPEICDGAEHMNDIFASNSVKSPTCGAAGSDLGPHLGTTEEGLSGAGGRGGGCCYFEGCVCHSE